MTDPRFPDRPEHPDLWLISQALIETDAQADADQGIGDITGRIVDPASLIYMAQQRATRAVISGAAPNSMAIVLTATWMDAFIAGARYQHLKASKAQEFDEPESEEA